MRITTNPGTGIGNSAKTQFQLRAVVLAGLGLALMVLLAGVARAQEPEDEYLRIYMMIQQADSYSTNGKTTQALAKYKEALGSLEDFRVAHLNWNTKAVTFRINDVSEKIAALSGKTSAPEAQSNSAATSGGGSGVPEVKLLEAGSEPRKQLRLHPKPGTKQSVTMTIKMSMDMKMGEMDNPGMKMPPMTMVMDSTVKSVSPDGDITYEMVMGEATVGEDPAALAPVVEAMKASVAGLKGLSLTGVMSNRGFNKGVDVKLPADAAPQMRQMMEQTKDSFSNMSAPLPEEPVGLGAKWEARMKPKSQGMTIDQTATYELASMEGDRLTTKSALTQKAANQKITNPAMPGLKVDLTKMNGTGSGQITWDEGQIMPPEGSLELHSEFSMAMDMGGKKQTMNMKVDMNLHLEAK